MILLQALTIGSLGYALGMGIAALFFEITLLHIPTRGIVLLWQAVIGPGSPCSSSSRRRASSASGGCWCSSLQSCFEDSENERK